MIDNPFSTNYPTTTDRELIETALKGSRGALETLLKRHQHYVYNVALKMVLSPFDAEDVTQEVLIKVITQLVQFRGDSEFRTWLYRITFNHVLRMKKTWLEERITTFSAYGDQIDAIPDEDLTAFEQAELAAFIEDGKLGCMNGMLLCLDRSQRLVYVLGEIFGIDHVLGAQLLAISKANFRQRLARARRELYQFMHGQCGLINPANACRCARKTKGFIQAGWVDEKRLKFNTAYLNHIHSVAPDKSADLTDALETTYADLFRKQPFQEKSHISVLLHTLLNDPQLKGIFDPN